MNFVETFIKGKTGINKGLTTGILQIDKSIDGIQKKSIYGVAAPPKVGKTTFVDYSFVISPYLQCLEETDKKVHFIYFSYEIDRIKKEFKFASYFMAKDYGIDKIYHQGKTYDMSSRYLLGKLTDDNGNLIPVSTEHEEKLRLIYRNRIVPLFGEYNEQGNKITEGKIDFIEERDNPTGMRNYIMRYAEKNGTFIKSAYQTKDENGNEVTRYRIIGYTPNDPNLTTIIITDHIRKLKRERGFTMKENIDKWIEYQVEFRNWCGFTFVDIAHINRNLSDVQRLKYTPEYTFPTGDDVKDSGNLSEECDFMFTIFNANDEKYGITKHFGLDLRDMNGNEKFPNYRSLHLVESRETECPLHFQLNMYAGINKFTNLDIPNPSYGM